MKISLNTIQKVFACIFILLIGFIASAIYELHWLQFIGLLMIASVLIYLIGLVKPKIVLIIIGSLMLIIGALILLINAIYYPKAPQKTGLELLSDEELIKLYEETKQHR